MKSMKIEKKKHEWNSLHGDENCISIAIELLSSFTKFIIKISTFIILMPFT